MNKFLCATVVAVLCITPLYHLSPQAIKHSASITDTSHALVTGTTPDVCLKAVRDRKNAGEAHRAITLLAAAEAKLQRMSSLVTEGVIDEQHMDGTATRKQFVAQLLRPNMAHIETKLVETKPVIPAGSMSENRVFATKTLFGLTHSYSESNTGYLHSMAPTQLFEASDQWYHEFPYPLTTFFTGATGRNNLSGVHTRAGEWYSGRLKERTFCGLRYLGRERWQDANYHVVEWSYLHGYWAPEDQPSYVTRLYIGSDTLIHRVHTTTVRNNRPMVRDHYLQSVIIDAPLDTTLFMTPREDARELEDHYRSGTDVWPEHIDSFPKMLMRGQTLERFDLRHGTAREIRVPTVQGKDFILSETMKRTRAVVLYSWFYSCGYCHVMLPQLEQLRAEYKDRGVEVIAISTMEDTPGRFHPDSAQVREEEDKLRRMVSYHDMTLPVGFSRPGSPFNASYRVSNSTFIVIDSRSGHVTFQEPAEPDMVNLRKAINTLLTTRPAYRGTIDWSSSIAPHGIFIE